MTLHQTGLRVLGSRVGGLILLVFALIPLLGGIVLFIVSLISNNLTDTTVTGIVISLIQALAFSWPAAFLLWMFPDIEVMPDRIRLKYLIFEQTVTRNEILRITTNEQANANAILLKKRGLLLNMMYGYFYYKVENQAIILLSLDQKSLSHLKNFYDGA